MAHLSLTESPTDSPRYVIFHYNDAHKATVLSSAILSILGCLFIIGSYIRWKEIRTPSRSILVFICVSDLLSVSANIAGVTSKYQDSTVDIDRLLQTNATDCDVEAAVNTFGSVSSFLWTVALAVYLYMALVRDNIARGNWLIYRIYSPLCWGIPLVITIVGSATGGLGFDNDYLTSGWCWVRVRNATKAGHVEIAWMFVAGKGWEILAYFTIAGLYIVIVCTIKSKVSLHSTSKRMPSEVEAMKKAQLKMMLIPVIFVLLRIWGTIRFIWVLCSPTTIKNYKNLLIALVFLHGIGDTAQGWANCLLFGCFTEKVRSKVKEGFKMKCSCCDHVKHQKKKKRHTLNDRSADFQPTLYRSENEDPWLIRSQSVERQQQNPESARGFYSSGAFHERSSLVQNEVA